MARPPRLRISEIFHSLQGEGLFTGERTAFVRLTGCPLRCSYCDTQYAFTGGEWVSIEEILGTVSGLDVHHVCVTGGEPLAQRDCLLLLASLCDAGYSVSLETSGALDLSAVDPRVVKVVDIKTPASGEADANLWENLEHLGDRDQIKLVICDREDYLWAVEQIGEHRLDRFGTLLFSPAAGSLSPQELAEWILRDRLPVRLQVQLHKLLWGDERGR